MTKIRSTVLLIPVLLAGCTGAPPAPSTSQSTSSSSAQQAAAAAHEPETSTPETATAPAGDIPAGDTPKGDAPAVTAAAVPLTDGQATLGPENTRIEFVGAHTGEKPDPRKGGFEQFSGKLSVEGEMLKDISFDIVTDSMWTEIGGKLTNHLKSPEIKFQSTKIEAGDEGLIEVTGDLTLHGVTKPITVPAKATINKDGISLTADFTIDRTEFGINYEPGKVEKTVSLKVSVGEKNSPKTAAAGG